MTVAPEISVLPTMDTAVIGDDVEKDFGLVTTNGDTVFPTIVSANIVWKFRNQIIMGGNSYRFSGGNDRIFIAAKETLGGNYSVEVTNAAGRVTAAFQLSVLGNQLLQMCKCVNFSMGNLCLQFP